MREKYISLEIFRGIAALMIVLFHFMIETFPSTTKWVGPLMYGVDFFFLLSGFIIYHVHRHDFAVKGKIIIFIKKRFIRIFLPYWCFLVLIIIAHNFMNAHDDTLIHWNAMSSKDYILSALLWPYGVPAHWPIINVSWTLTREIIFYLIFGCSLLFSRKYFWLILAIWGGGALAYTIPLTRGILTNFFTTINAANFVEVIVGFHVFLFIGGVIIAQTSQWINDTLQKKHRLLLSYITCTIGILALAYCFDLAINGPGMSMETRRWGWYGFSLIIFGSVVWEKNTAPTKNQSIMVKAGLLLGAASYSIYLMHYPIMKLVGNYFYTVGNDSTSELAIRAVIIFFVIVGSTIALYFLVEKPALQWGRHALLGGRKKKIHPQSIIDRVQAHFDKIVITLLLLMSLIIALSLLELLTNVKIQAFTSQSKLEYEPPKIGGTITVRGNKEVIIFDDGSKLKVSPRRMQGKITSTKKANNIIEFTGWAVDLVRKKPADKVLIFVNNTLFYEGSPNQPQRHVVNHYKEPNLLKSGFKFKFKEELLLFEKEITVRIFAISKESEAMELRYYKK